MYRLERPAGNEPYTGLVKSEEVFNEIPEVDTSIGDVEKGQSPPVAVSHFQSARTESSFEGTMIRTIGILRL